MPQLSHFGAGLPDLQTTGNRNTFAGVGGGQLPNVFAPTSVMTLALTQNPLDHQAPLKQEGAAGSSQHNDR